MLFVEVLHDSNPLWTSWHRWSEHGTMVEVDNILESKTQLDMKNMNRSMAMHTEILVYHNIMLKPSAARTNNCEATCTTRAFAPLPEPGYSQNFAYFHRIILLETLLCE
jgi:hypothetical protein